MKLWQIDSILGGNRHMPSTVAASNEGWRYLKNLFDEMHELRNTGNWAVLNSELPPDFVVAVLSNIEKYCFLSQDGWLRSYRMDNEDSRLSFVECFRKYGGEILEDVCEKGSFNVG